MRENEPKMLIIHHEGGNNGFEKVNAYHKEKWNFKSSLGFYIGYQYYIDKEGRLYQGRVDTDEGIHTINYNLKSIAVCCQGNFEIESPTKEQLKTLEELLDKLREKWKIAKTKIYGHRELKPTLCPGRNLFSWLKNYRKKDLNEIQKALFEIQKKIEGLKKLLELFKGR